jgi:hypothetical protein
MPGPKHPMQPIVLDSHGVARFKANAIVRHLLDNGGIDLNRIAMLPFNQEDREQFAQLIGYSVSGFGDLGYADPATVAAADALVEIATSRCPGDAPDALLDPGAMAARLAADGLLAPGAEVAARDRLAAFAAAHRKGERERIKGVIDAAVGEYEDEIGEA